MRRSDKVGRETENEAYTKLSPLMSNVALGKGILISKFAQARKQQTLQPGPNYAIRAAAENDECCSQGRTMLH